MTLLNTERGYGALSKMFHWLIVALFAFQYVAAAIMLNIEGPSTVLGQAQGFWFNGHKSIGLIALVVAIARIMARRAGALPAWAACLSARERALIPHLERTLYAAMFVMPVSGFVYVMAGEFGVRFLGVVDVPNPIGVHASLAWFAKWTHILAAWGLAAVLMAHFGIVARHTLIRRDSYLARMLPRGLEGGGDA
jgi:cytochrome b561